MSIGAAFNFGVLLFVAVGLYGCNSASPPAPQNAVPTYLPPGLKPADVVLNSSVSIDAYRINPKRGKDRTQGIFGYPILAGPVRLDAPVSRRIVDLAQDPRAHDPATKWCGEIEPGIALRLASQAHTLTILVCFKCEDWEFWLDGEKLEASGFSGVQPQLLKMARQLFPADPVLRDIPMLEAAARMYRIDALRNAPTSFVDYGKRREIEGQWEKKVVDAVGELANWLNYGGSKYYVWFMLDREYMIVVTTPAGHAAAAKVPGVFPMPIPAGE